LWKSPKKRGEARGDHVLRTLTGRDVELVGKPPSGRVSYRRITGGGGLFHLKEESRLSKGGLRDILRTIPSKLNFLSERSEEGFVSYYDLSLLDQQVPSLDVLVPRGSPSHVLITWMWRKPAGLLGILKEERSPRAKGGRDVCRAKLGKKVPGRKPRRQEKRETVVLASLKKSLSVQQDRWRGHLQRCTKAGGSPEKPVLSLPTLFSPKGDRTIVGLLY